MTSDFEWTPQREEAAEMLAEGYLQKDVAEKVGITTRALYDWRQEPAFAEEVDRLTLMRGNAIKAERVRIAKRAIRQLINEETGELETKKDVLDWLKYLQSETNGAIFSVPELTAFLANAASVAGSGQTEPATADRPATAGSAGESE